MVVVYNCTAQAGSMRGSSLLTSKQGMDMNYLLMVPHTWVSTTKGNHMARASLNGAMESITRETG